MSSQDLPASSKNRIISSWPISIQSCTLAVAIFGFVTIWIGIPPSNTVFLSSWFVRVMSNDAWHHMRTFNILLNNYPNRAFFNPMTNYPYGSYIHFGPLFDQMMVVTSLILGLGHPSSEFVDHIGAYFPAVLGALTVIPVY